jgi:hypothetical protein
MIGEGTTVMRPLVGGNGVGEELNSEYKWKK